MGHSGKGSQCPVLAKREIDVQRVLSLSHKSLEALPTACPSPLGGEGTHTHGLMLLFSFFWNLGLGGG